MNLSVLQSAYSTKDFRERGHLLIDELSDYLQTQLNDSKTPVLGWRIPEDEYRFWKDFLTNGNETELFPQILKRITAIHNPKYIGHQVAPTAPITALTAMISGLLNNGMAVYEMGMAPNAIERVITDIICNMIGYSEVASGFLTSGGTLANLTALLTARRTILKQDVWNDGLQAPIAIMVSEEAHYCIDRAAKIMGLGEKGIIKIPATSNFQMDTSLLEEKYHEAKSNGIAVFAIVGSAPCTATGTFDELNDIALFAEKHKLWFHVDGAHGGAGIFSPKYKHTVKSIEKADSVVIDGHKMMMMPGITTALLYKNGKNANATFSQKADYLLTESEHEDWYNSGKKTFECTKNMMCIHWYTLLKIYGEGVFDANVTQLYDMGIRFAAIIESESNFELAVKPMSNIVCFRFIDPKLSLKEQNELNFTIRQKLLEDGAFYIVQTKLRDIHYLRVTVMNPFTTEKHFKNLLSNIKEIAVSI